MSAIDQNAARSTDAVFRAAGLATAADAADAADAVDAAESATALAALGLTTFFAAAAFFWGTLAATLRAALGLGGAGAAAAAL